MKKHEFPLPLSRLKELAHNTPSPEVLELLWEIKRLRHLLRMDRLEIDDIRLAWMEAVGGNHPGIHQMYSRLKHEPAAE